MLKKSTRPNGPSRTRDVTNNQVPLLYIIFVHFDKKKVFAKMTIVFIPILLTNKE